MSAPLGASEGFLDNIPGQVHDDADMVETLVATNTSQPALRMVASAAAKPASSFTQSLDEAERGTGTLSVPIALQTSARRRPTNPLKIPGAG
jgi:hypothetical protein